MKKLESPRTALAPCSDSYPEPSGIAADSVSGQLAGQLAGVTSYVNILAGNLLALYSVLTLLFAFDPLLACVKVIKKTSFPYLIA